MLQYHNKINYDIVMKENSLAITDIMSGLMMVFLFIAVVFMLHIQRQKDAMVDIAKLYEQNREQLYIQLIEEFESDLIVWNAEILEDNTVRFNAPKVLFEHGSNSLRSKFKSILDNFFPRYIKILQQYQKDIIAVRIEGHTSSDWGDANTPVNIRYLKNVQLSQQRALSTLEYCYSLLVDNDNKREWLQKVIQANGLSFAKRVINSDGSENKLKSRRVEFKVITNAEQKLYQILEGL